MVQGVYSMVFEYQLVRLLSSAVYSFFFSLFGVIKKAQRTVEFLLSPEEDSFTGRKDTRGGTGLDLTNKHARKTAHLALLI